MAEFETLERRIAALEAKMGNEDVKAIRRDLRRSLDLQDAALDLMEKVHTRVVANELIATANARTTEQGFANVQAQLSAMDTQLSTMDTRLSALDAKLESEVGRLESQVGQVKTDVAALRRDLPGMMAETLREFFKEQRGEG